MSEALQLSPSAALQPVAAAPDAAALLPFTHGRYAIPADDLHDFAALKAEERERITLLLSFFRRMETEGPMTRVAETIAFQYRHVRGYSAANLEKLYYAWIDNGWSALCRGYNNGKAPLPAAFVTHMRALMEQNGRSMKQAMVVLQRSWMAGESIPGYGTWRDWFFATWPDRDIPATCPRYPDGWGKSNLYAIQPKKAARALTTKGFAAAKQHLPSMVRDTSSLLPLQLITLDDFECDHLCFYHDPATGRRELCKMTGVAAMDVATRRVIGLVLKPRLTDDQGKEQAITRAEVRFLLYQLLKDYGIPTHGMTILAERAAAAITAELETTFLNLFGGRVRVSRTNMIADKVLANGFIERGGKPWLKGWIESLFNLLQNMAAPLPGYKGRNYIEKPGQLEEAKRTTLRLIGTGRDDAQLSDAQLVQARPTFLSHTDLADAYMRLFDLIEQRTEHQMVGFAEVMQYRCNAWEAYRPLDDEFASLTQEQQLRCEFAARMQSPRERWAALWPKVTCQQVDVAALMLLLLTPKRATWKRQRLHVAHGRVGYTFAQHATALADLPEGTEVLVYFDPANCTSAHVCQIDGRYLGEVRRLGPVDITDQAAVTAAEKQLAEIYNGLRAEVRARPLHQVTDAQLQAHAEHNARLVEEAQQTRGLTASLSRTLPAPGEQPETAVALHAASTIAAAAVQEGEQKAARRATRRAIAQAEAQLSAEDLAAANGTEEQPAPAEEFSPEEISQLLSDD